MEGLWWDATVWFLLALIASLISLRLGISAALIELIVGIVAGNTIHPPITQWITFLASVGAVVLTFLAGAELETEVVKRYWKESLVLGLVGFFSPFIGAWLIAQYLAWMEYAPSSARRNSTFDYISGSCVCGYGRNWAE
jgi:Kef-type K+ transport system membrane component KefB